MARRYDHTPEQLRELASASGTRMMVEVGYHEFSARGVATRMGYTVGTLYNLFENLDMFILHVNALTLDEWYGNLSARLAQPDHDPIDALARGYYEFAQQNYNRFLALFEHQMEEVPDWYQPKLHRFFDLVEETLRAKGMRQERASHLAKALWAGVHGVTVLSLSGKLQLLGADDADTLMKTVLTGLLTE